MRDQVPLCQAIALYTAADHRNRIDRDEIGMTYWDMEMVDDLPPAEDGEESEE